MTTKENIIQYIGVENTPNTDLYFIYGRMNPMHPGHLGLVNELIRLATEAKLASGNRKVKVRIFLSTSLNNNNPLIPQNKVNHAKKVLSAYNLNLNSLGEALGIDIKIMPLPTPSFLPATYKQTQLHMLMGENRWIKKIKGTKGPGIKNRLVNNVETSIKNNKYNNFRTHILASEVSPNFNIRGLFNHARRIHLNNERKMREGKKVNPKLVMANFNWLVKRRNRQHYLPRPPGSISATKVRKAARNRNLDTLRTYYGGKLNNNSLLNLMNKIQASNAQREEAIKRKANTEASNAQRKKVIKRKANTSASASTPMTRRRRTPKPN